MSRYAAPEPRLGRIDAGASAIAYRDWGSADAADVLVCAHGLTRNAQDFDPLAALLSRDRRVIAFDFPGRGASGWLADPAAYGYPTYLAGALALLDALGLGAVDWLGTSMGGILGMLVATEAPARVRRLILNDVGAVVTKESLQRIAGYVGADPEFADAAAAERYLRLVLAGFGALDDATWRRIALSSVRPAPGGKLRLHYDPTLAIPLQGTERADLDLRPLWAAVAQPVLLIRGADSDLLTAAVAQAMAERPGVTLVTIPDAGHAPSLMVADQIQLIGRWLAAA